MSESLRDFVVVVFAMIGSRWLLCGMKVGAAFGRSEGASARSSQRHVPAVQG